MTIAQSQLERMESITRMVQRRTRINEITKFIHRAVETFNRDYF